PHGHRIDPDEFAGQAGDKQFAPILALDERPKRVWHLESTFVIYSSGCIAPEHALANLYWPFNSTKVHGDSREGTAGSQPQNLRHQQFAQNFNGVVTQD